MKKLSLVLIGCLLLVTLTGCAAKAGLPMTQVKLGTSLKDAQKLEPEREEYQGRDVRPAQLYVRNCDFEGVTGELFMHVTYQSLDPADDKGWISSMDWNTVISSDEHDPGETLSSHHVSATPGADARALYQQLIDAITKSVGIEPYTSEEQADESAFGRVAYAAWVVNEEFSIYCQLRFKPDYVGWSENYTISCSAYPTKR